MTPLMLAATWGSVEAARALLDAGADVCARASLQHKDEMDEARSRTGARPLGPPCMGLCLACSSLLFRQAPEPFPCAALSRSPRQRS